MKGVSIILLGLLPFLFFKYVFAQNSGTGIPPNESRTLNKPIPNVRLVDHNGRVFHIYDLKGKPVILSPIYTHCQSACPLITESLKTNIYKLGTPGKDFYVISFTFDPEDQIEDLKRFRHEKNIDDEDWLVAKAYTKEELFKLVDAIDFRFMSIPETRDFAHPNLLVFLSPNLVIKRYVYGVSFRHKDLERALRYSMGELNIVELLRPYLLFISLLSIIALSLFVILKVTSAQKHTNVEKTTQT